ncbi:uncharacterized protein LOC123439933 [Hordeum vulgare subsp. vulgare]|uniref:uncharacterized protein LOC123439933 n=1 Tax=Hordeum vulgare subsp. vulgare TaxID=112509 RepID=UPI001D1A3D07|nr:uncharacterized protein LOC123439933 [Hordeum vulgare subsp. vulgare]KAI5000773.1 hypothetical protein ZWY2020_010732 [Hordeum vulgare]KAI5000775.1 hypothetical protein ZWY2020_010734 [Hordeum vulgare]
MTGCRRRRLSTEPTPPTLGAQFHAHRQPLGKRADGRSLRHRCRHGHNLGLLRDPIPISTPQYLGRKFYNWRLEGLF